MCCVASRARSAPWPSLGRTAAARWEAALLAWAWPAERGWLACRKCGCLRDRVKFTCTCLAEAREPCRAAAVKPALPACPLLQSFTLNQLLGVGCEEGFGVGHTRLTQTKGVWMWGEPVPVTLPSGETTHVSWGGWRVGRGSKPCRAAVPVGQLWGSMCLPFAAQARLAACLHP